jgi:hypothetical protein
MPEASLPICVFWSNISSETGLIISIKEKLTNCTTAHTGTAYVKLIQYMPALQRTWGQTTYVRI